MSVVMYHNPRCSKSRQTLELLRQNGVEPTLIEYLKTPPTHQELQRILALLGLKPRELMRRKENEYKELDLDRNDLSESDLIDAMIKTPKLIERPIVIHGDRAAIGRPPEAVLKVL